jgi:hypothetical protein
VILAALLLAATADLSVIDAVPSKTSVHYDETFSVTARVHNAGPDAAEAVRVLIGGNGTTFLLGITAPAGWTCDALPRYAAAVSCVAPALAAAAEARFTLTLTAPQPTANTYRVGASIAAASTDPRRTDNVYESDMALVAPPRSAALRLTGTAAANPVAERGEIRVRYDVHNAGPDDARDVLVLFASEVPFTASGAGWSCTGVTCTRAELPAGTTAPLELRATAPATEDEISIVAHVRAEQIFDSDRRDNESLLVIGVGNAANWQRLLIPVADSFVPGSGGARWTTELAALLLADERPEFAPHPCEFSSGLCFIQPAPLRRQIDAFRYLILDDNPSGQYFYVRPQDAAKWRFNARIHDEARVEQTAGAEMPIVRDSEFRSDTIALLNVPVAPQYRHTLRIYDDAGRDRVSAAIRIYAAGETEPRVSVVRELVRVQRQTTTSALLPTHPAYAQAELAQLGSLAGMESLRVEVEPLDPGVRLWAFVSIVNNETHHVTVVTPQ